MFQSLWYSKTKLITLAAVLILSGCGGSSGNKNKPPPPPANVAPAANAGPDQAIGRMVMVTLDGSGSTDSDGTVASYAWTQTVGTVVTLDSATAAMPTFTSPDTAAGEDLTFSLVVTDDDGAASTADTVVITVSANAAPSADAGPDQTVSSLDVVTLDGSASTDSDGTIAGYAWTQTTGAAVTLDETVPAMPTFTAPNVGGDEVLTFELVVTDNDGAPSLADSVVITINPTLALPFSDNFSDGNFDEWTTVDDTVTNASIWDASSNRLVNNGPTHNNFGDLDETYHRGTYAYLTDSVNLTNYRFEVDITQRPSLDSLEDLGVMFRYTDNDHYYRFSMNSAKGFARLESKAGVDTGGDPIWRTLAHDFRGYEPGQAINVIVEVDGPLIQVFVNGDDLFAAYDEDHASGGVALYTRDGIRFDNVSIATNDTGPEIVIASPVANSVVPGGPRDISIVAIARNIPAGGTVNLEFTGGAACDAVTEVNVGEFRASCTNRPVGTHEIVAAIRDGGGDVNRDRNVDVHLGTPGFGDRYEAIGDSLTLGLRDRFSRDNLNLTDRKTISSSGWTGPLSDLLTTTLLEPNTVGNEGYSGDRASETRRDRIASILERNRVPKSSRSLLMLGTNDAVINAAATPAEYEADMTSIIQSLLGSGRDTVYVAILPPVWSNNSNQALFTDPLDFDPVSATYAERNANIDGFNQVVINTLAPMANVELGPDLFSCFLSPTVNRSSLFEDALHMNGLGYAFVAALWHDAITVGPPTPGGACPSPIFILEDLDVPYVHGLKQNLLEAGDVYYRDEAFTLSNVPPELADGVWISQSNADRTNTDADFMTFDVGAGATVYIAYDPAGGPPTSSTHVFAASALSEALTVSDPAAGTLSVVEAAAVGTVTIGGTESDLSGTPRQGYVVIVVP